jgi:hypothetical protein
MADDKKRNKPFSSDDLEFDRHGRLIIKNDELAQALVNSMVRAGGLQLRFPDPVAPSVPLPSEWEDPRLKDCPPPLERCGPPQEPPLSLCPNTNCVCSLDLPVRRRDYRQFRNPTKSGDWEDLS